MDTEYSNRIREQSGVRPLSTVIKTLAVLDALASSPRGMRLPEVAAAMNLSRPTAYQRLLTLIEAGWIEQDEDMRYRLSMHACRFAAAALEQADLGARVQPVLEALVHKVKETASVAVLDREGPSAGASAGNAGAFAFTDILPLASPGILRKAPNWRPKRCSPKPAARATPSPAAIRTAASSPLQRRYSTSTANASQRCRSSCRRRGSSSRNSDSRCSMPRPKSPAFSKGDHR